MTPAIQWYPGHIAKAERSLLEQLKRVDVILEVRDARIPLATCHPQIGNWVGSKEKILVVNRVDMISAQARTAWETWFRDQGDTPYFANAQQGKGVAGIAKAAKSAGTSMNQRRRNRGMRPRAVRAVVIGFPNVGKSALINRLLNRKVVDSARKPGVTRQLRWIRISDDLELLDAPGILPAQLKDQKAALRLAICDDIGQAAYDNQRIAASLVDLFKSLENQATDAAYIEALHDRYGIALADQTGESYLQQMAEIRYQGDRERAARSLLHDYRVGHLGNLPLEWPPA
ncbi:ribosome biogenesis GTPase YlqF [Oscillatoria sp. CS-180]|uniref:ribosome biogenesis GTPase YlqF n=1 Tax=Oscillatoria sp. CS-180 TaxID=3021720 RepID=UPI002330A954|nr:ribosome biogenesis GTPase YlqF [Oscillatoria sp. CS-180]MDB9526889.1 ribosome biogenesis GTPase YlqF [Oscillatoria sp. CS-180]